MPDTASTRPVGTGAADRALRELSMSPFPRTRNRLLLALPRREFDRLKPALQHVQCSRAQVLVDADSSLEHVYFPTAVSSRSSLCTPMAALSKWPPSAAKEPPASKPC